MAIIVDGTEADAHTDDEGARFVAHPSHDAKVARDTERIRNDFEGENVTKDFVLSFECESSVRACASP